MWINGQTVKSRLDLACMRWRTYNVILMRHTSLHRSYWQCECGQEKGPRRCVVLIDAPQAVDPLNKALELFGLRSFLCFWVTCTWLH